MLPCFLLQHAISYNLTFHFLGLISALILLQLFLTHHLVCINIFCLFFVDSEDIPGIGQYEDFHTIDWQRDIARDRMRHRYIVKKKKNSLWDTVKGAHDAWSGWLCVFLVGVVTGTVAGIIDIGSSWMTDLKFGICPDAFWLNMEQCCWSSNETTFAGVEGNCSQVFMHFSWRWFRNSRFSFLKILFLFWKLVAYVVRNFRFVSCWILGVHRLLPIVCHFCPLICSSGCRIGQSFCSLRLWLWSAWSNFNVIKLPSSNERTYVCNINLQIFQIKTILGGFIIRGYLGKWTLIIKSIGIMLAVSAGLSLGKEGPMVHIASCIGNFCFHEFISFWIIRFNNLNHS